MAIQPIDLQAMYAQMAHVAENAQRMQEGPSLASAMQRQNAVEQNLEEQSRVTRSVDDDAQAVSQSVKNDGRGGTAQGEAKRKGDKGAGGESGRAGDAAGAAFENVRESFIGQNVDITR